MSETYVNPVDPPDEPFELLDPDGRPTGTVKPRHAVHRDGDWHGAFHVWIAWRDGAGEPCLLLQRRSRWKDTMAGMVDVSVGGHYRAGEQPGSRLGRDEPARSAVLRELREELGLAVRAEALVPVGRRWMERAGSGWIDREVQDIFALPLPAAPERLAPDAGEVEALLVVELPDLRALVAGEHATAPVWELPVRADGGLDAPREAALTLEQLVPDDDRYWEWMAETLRRLLEGTPPGWFELRRRAQGGGERGGTWTR
ncbi:NUDIX domain-containing protein [Thermomicrobiaceae bacterium CFH 74404]|uniref:NUDIX domain-containing protein n=1 Tax=Thermalbibacter longus TaxID=2951981 RepID=A0AA41WCE4_9BACT|nr:NUDIX domain-containing protein [Thermalbibacter longus]MCM8748418.1 NUDIX domain-containing protein [Thermalbibacter longus]